ncbi:cystinosin homolog [Macadamia integrifolia]|uniref:cystinosin homolog n=1 Tax=Macadamia integrifolia TaxID=60698 RepID=UPI001C4FEBF7|nr:cystinosin homolog [Macadamia integrifolia]
MVVSWKSHPLEIAYNFFGWIAFFSWSFSFYPQVILNYRRKGVVGLNFDFLVLNFTKHSSYLIYNASLFFSHVVQRQYQNKYGGGGGGGDQMIPVAANDVAFSIHAVALTTITLLQVYIYEGGGQKVSKTCIAITCVAWGSAAICFFISLPHRSWLWLISVFNIIQVVMTAIKYIPQAYMNFRRKSTQGWSIGNILLDLLGGLMNYAQMAMQSIDQGSWVNLYGNIGKTLLSLLSICFDLLFICQHYLLYYPSKKEKVVLSPNKSSMENSSPVPENSI